MTRRRNSYCLFLLACLAAFGAKWPEAYRRADSDRDSRQGSGWVTPQSRVPDVPRMAQRVVPAAEILSTSDGDSTAPGKLTKLANTVIPDRSTPYSIQPSGDDLTGRHGETPENPADGSAARLRAAESVTIPPGPSAWQEPKALLECLRALGDDSVTRGWAGEARVRGRSSW